MNTDRFKARLKEYLRALVFGNEYLTRSQALMALGFLLVNYSVGWIFVSSLIVASYYYQDQLTWLISGNAPHPENRIPFIIPFWLIAYWWGVNFIAFYKEDYEHINFRPLIHAWVFAFYFIALARRVNPPVTVGADTWANSLDRLFLGDGVLFPAIAITVVFALCCLIIMEPVTKFREKLKQSNAESMKELLRKQNR